MNDAMADILLSLLLSFPSAVFRFVLQFQTSETGCIRQIDSQGTVVGHLNELLSIDRRNVHWLQQSSARFHHLGQRESSIRMYCTSNVGFAFSSSNAIARVHRPTTNSS